MIVPSFRTWSTGEVVRASYFNSNVRDAGNFFLTLPMMECTQSFAQSIPNSLGTALSFNANDVDTDAGHNISTATTRYTAKTAGRYQIEGGVSFTLNNDFNARQVEIDVNGFSVPGSDVCNMGFAADNTRLATRIRQYFLHVNDYVEIFCFQASGVALNTIVSGQQKSHMNVRWITST